ncbi:MAG: IS66 family insertion sequence element accessory protein TnpB [Gammaproteobacteria bacterium]|nr:IS66 family insertion sequence element accessory protein TnpB [Gammaproteobacteria bacterium]
MFVEPNIIYLHRDIVDFRKSINGLSLTVEQELAMDVYSSALFVFCNKQRDKLKILYWDRTGFALWYKRLEKQKFKWPKQGEQTMNLSEQQLKWLLSGYDTVGHQACIITKNPYNI